MALFNEQLDLFQDIKINKESVSLWKKDMILKKYIHKRNIEKRIKEINLMEKYNDYY